MRYYLVLMSLLLLSGCGTIQKLVCEDKSPPEKQVIIDPRYLEDCQSLQPLSSAAEVTFETVLVNTADNAILYAECKNKQKGSINLIKMLGNIK